MKRILNQMISDKNQGKKSLAILIDPDKSFDEKLLQKIKPDYIFIGGSLLKKDNLDDCILRIKQITEVPVIIFPGDFTQISKQADGILFLSLISGRNPEYLIGQHIKAASVLAQTDLEIISTGYILIENGKTTSVEYISNTRPIPRDKPEIALATALAGQMLGMQTIYLEAGSGALHPVPLKTVSLLAEKLQIPIIVGGGIRTREEIEKYFAVGADIVVVGTAFEQGKFV